MDDRLFPIVVNAAATTPPPAVRYEKTDPAPLLQGATILPPQIGEASDRTKNALPHFEGTSTRTNTATPGTRSTRRRSRRCRWPEGRIEVPATHRGVFPVRGSDLLSPQALFTDGWTIAGWVNFTTKPSRRTTW